MRRTIALIALVLAGSASANAAVVTRTDDAGRTIRFAVDAPNVDVDRFADVLRDAIHGAEIERVTIRIVTRAQVRRICGRSAVACYGGGRRAARIVMPSTGSRLTETLLHEYAHHVDATRRHGAAREPNGTPRWFAARRIGARLRTGELRHDYSRGWQRSVGEIFAEDYVRLHFRAPWRLTSVRAPTAAVLRALRTDLTGSAVGDDPAPPPPLVTTRSGRLAPGEVVRIPFGLLGTGRRIQVTVALDGEGTPARGVVRVRCNGALVAEAEATDALDATIDRPGQGPGDCSVELTGSEGAPRYGITLTLSIQG